MANTFITVKEFARAALPRLIEHLVFPNLIHKDFSDDFSARRGDTVQVRKPVVLEAREFDPAAGVSTHQMGCAIDTSLVRVKEITWNLCGGYVYPTVTAYTDGTMPTPIHELSIAAASLSKPVNSGSKTAWKSIPAAAGMTEDALRLRAYCTAAELYPLASEWWHFNDLDTKAAVKDLHVTTPYHLNACVSQIPE